VWEDLRGRAGPISFFAADNATLLEKVAKRDVDAGQAEATTDGSNASCCGHGFTLEQLTSAGPDLLGKALLAAAGADDPDEAAVAALEVPAPGLAGAAIGMPATEPASEPEPASESEPAVVAGSFSYSSPTIFNNTLYVGNLDHRLYAIDIETGKMKWRYKTDAPVTSSPRVHKGNLYFGSNDGNVYAVDTDPLGVLWRSKTNHWVNSSPLIDGKKLYIGGNDMNLYAFNLKTGRADWRHRTLGPVISIPVSYKNLVIFAGGKGDGRIYGVDKRHGKLFWSYKTGGRIESDPVIDGNKLFVSSADGYLYAFSILKTRAH